MSAGKRRKWYSQMVATRETFPLRPRPFVNAGCLAGTTATLMDVCQQLPPLMHRHEDSSDQKALGRLLADTTLPYAHSAVLDVNAHFCYNFVDAQAGELVPWIRRVFMWEPRRRLFVFQEQLLSAQRGEAAAFPIVFHFPNFSWWRKGALYTQLVPYLLGGP
ncbi:unnamed protein product [Vitrella brassicaformis CCMP3155]|uniref:Uncharacterized protein n=1 Tax=Vitrella brassicaformis (strain CCMP3155) TaxID=1169540 RepID=A0A0G4FD98_VITBC|nr:unnamed protein product [Vitrella brassicaformis CCMP3155]|eukprot:CEM11209.1 unnamed protein product [Vitrella brassicaformis CCMP3155]